MVKITEKTHKNHQIKPEFSRIIDVDEVVSSDTPVTIEIIADDTERNALAKRFGLLAVSSLGATVRLQTVAGFGVDNNTDILAVVKFRACLMQTCSVTLDPINDTIEASFKQLFSPQSNFPKNDNADDSDDEEFLDVTDADMDEFVDSGPMADPPEPIIDGKIDIGELIAEELAVRINPFPRKKGVNFEWVSQNKADLGAKSGPFAALGALKFSGEGGKNPKK